MARIIGLKEKQLALKEVQNHLKSLTPLNAFIEAPNPQNEYTICFDTHKATLICEDKEKINELVRAYKASIVEKIKQLAERYEIELDDDDLALMK